MYPKKLTIQEHLAQARFWAAEAERAHKTMVDCADIVTSLATLSSAHSLIVIAQGRVIQALTQQDTTRSLQ